MIESFAPAAALPAAEGDQGIAKSQQGSNSAGKRPAQAADRRRRKRQVPPSQKTFKAGRDLYAPWRPR